VIAVPAAFPGKRNVNTKDSDMIYVHLETDLRVDVTTDTELAVFILATGEAGSAPLVRKMQADGGQECVPADHGDGDTDTEFPAHIAVGTARGVVRLARVD
jgi:hypothetical protein